MNKERKTTTDVVFQKTVCKVPWNIRTQQEDRQFSDWRFAEECLWDMFEDDDDFVTLTAGEIHHNIRFVQACRCAEGIVVELGIEEDDHTKLVQKVCTEQECLAIFKEFYRSTAVQDLESYRPTEFFV